MSDAQKPLPAATFVRRFFFVDVGSYSDVKEDPAGAYCEWSDVEPIVEELRIVKSLTDISKAFHDLAVGQRDRAWREVEVLKAEVRRLEELARK